MAINKIDGGTSKPIGPTGGDGRTRALRETPQSPAGGSKVELSSTAARLQQIEQVINDTPVVDSARVGEIRQAITEGRFQVNPERVADGLIESVRQLLSTQGRQA